MFSDYLISLSPICHYLLWKAFKDILIQMSVGEWGNQWIEIINYKINTNVKVTVG